MTVAAIAKCDTYGGRNRYRPLPLAPLGYSPLPGGTDGLRATGDRNGTLQRRCSPH
jgi:hypothetical protein